jgi:protein-S-isoprenylcysteine O-methyltransferase Ste14
MKQVMTSPSPRPERLRLSRERLFIQESRGREGGNVSQGVGVLIFTVVGLVIAAILGVLEIRCFLEVDRDAPPQIRRAARGRLVRRGVGALMLAVGVVLARYLVLPDEASVTVRLLRMGGCLTLCVGLLGLAIWDFRIVQIGRAHV